MPKKILVSLAFSWLFNLPIHLIVDNRHVMRSFFQKNIPSNWPVWADGQNRLRVFGVFPSKLSAHILSLRVPSLWFSINRPLFLQKHKLWYILKENIFGIGIWIWAVKNLRFSHSSDVSEPSYLELKDFQLGSARDLFRWAGRKNFSSKIRKRGIFCHSDFFPYFYQE